MVRPDHDIPTGRRRPVRLERGLTAADAGGDNMIREQCGGGIGGLFALDHEHRLVLIREQCRQTVERAGGRNALHAPPLPAVAEVAVGEGRNVLEGGAALVLPLEAGGVADQPTFGVVVGPSRHRHAFGRMLEPALGRVGGHRHQGDFTTGGGCGGLTVADWCEGVGRVEGHRQAPMPKAAANFSAASDCRRPNR